MLSFLMFNMCLQYLASLLNSWFHHVLLSSNLAHRGFANCGFKFTRVLIVANFFKFITDCLGDFISPALFLYKCQTLVSEME